MLLVPRGRVQTGCRYVFYGQVVEIVRWVSLLSNFCQQCCYGEKIVMEYSIICSPLDSLKYHLSSTSHHLKAIHQDCSLLAMSGDSLMTFTSVSLLSHIHQHMQKEPLEATFCFCEGDYEDMVPYITQNLLGIVGKEVPGKVLILLNSWFVFNNCVILVIDGIVHFVLTAEKVSVKSVSHHQQRTQDPVTLIVYSQCHLIYLSHAFFIVMASPFNFLILLRSTHL